MDCEAFEIACARAAALPRGENGIGTLSEKSLHAALKFYFVPDAASHEVRIGSYIADAIGEEGVVEIQSRGMYRMIHKLDAFLEACTVTVVHPLYQVKWLAWMRPDGTLISRRKSPTHATVYDAIPELYGIRFALDNPRFRFCVCMVEVEEQWEPDARGRCTRRTAKKIDRVPIRLFEEYHFDCPSDYLQFLPVGLPTVFDAREVAGKAHIPITYARTLLNILRYLEQITQVGKKGNTLLYSLTNPLAVCGFTGGGF